MGSVVWVEDYVLNSIYLSTHIRVLTVDCCRYAAKE